MKILVKSDVYNICNRIKKFDQTYCLVFDTDCKRYQIYSSCCGETVELIGGIALSYVCGLPYSELDERVVSYLYYTCIENIDSIISQIDTQNKNLEHKNEQELLNQSIDAFENKMRQLT